MFRALIFCALFCFCLQADAQQQLYWAAFDDKIDNQYSILQPEAFLSPRSIEKRRKLGIPVEFDDLPVDQSKLDQIRALGVSVHYTSRWENGAILIVKKSDIELLQALPFILTIEKIGKKPFPFRGMKSRETKRKTDYKTLDNRYGLGKQQASQVGIPPLHDQGFEGQNIWIAVFDGGFYNVDQMPFFDSLRVNNQFLEGWDFVQMDNDPYHGSKHGTDVLSTMASNLPGLLVGTAPKATYVCFRTENAGNEYLIEEYNWLLAAERADSLGIDLITSSLGYNNFDDRSSNHTYEDMDGISTVITKAANKAFAKGMLVVSSAGNEGNDPWFYITSPADSEDVLTIGSVDVQGFGSSFSSRGPTADGRLKPNLAARGRDAIVAGTVGYQIGYANGTSFSAPIVSGATASLWSALPELRASEIKDLMESSGDRVNRPSVVKGFGIPKVNLAYEFASFHQMNLRYGESFPAIQYSPFGDVLRIRLILDNDCKLHFRISDVLGRPILDETTNGFIGDTFEKDLTFEDLDSGWYYLEISAGAFNWRGRFLNH